MQTSNYTMPKQKPGHSKQDYGTPPEFLTAVRNRLKIKDFFIDLAANINNAVCPPYYSIDEGNDALAPDTIWNLTDGDGWAWLNPPYARIEPWVKRACEEAEKGTHIAVLVPASVGADWWRDYVANNCFQVFLNGRLTFVGETTPYPKDCALLLYTPWRMVGNEVWNWRLWIK